MGSSLESHGVPVEHGGNDRLTPAGSALPRIRNKAHDAPGATAAIGTDLGRCFRVLHSIYKYRCSVNKCRDSKLLVHRS